MDDENLKGGLADNLSIEDIAQKHGVAVEVIQAQLEKGLAVEKEHTDDVQKATEIALDHLVESADYYDKLAKVEAPQPEAPKAPEQPQITIDMVKSAVADAVAQALAEATKQFNAKLQEEQNKTQIAIDTLKAENQELKRTAPTGVPNPPPFVDDEASKRIKQTADVAESYRKGYRV